MANRQQPKRTNQCPRSVPGQVDHSLFGRELHSGIDGEFLQLATWSMAPIARPWSGQPKRETHSQYGH